MSYAKIQAQELTIVNRNQLDNKIKAQTLAIQEEVKVQQKKIKKR